MFGESFGHGEYMLPLVAREGYDVAVRLRTQGLGLQAIVEVDDTITLLDVSRDPIGRIVTGKQLGGIYNHYDPSQVYVIVGRGTRASQLIGALQKMGKMQTSAAA